MTETVEAPQELTLEESKARYTKNAGQAAETAMLDFTALQDVGFSDEQAIQIMGMWYAKMQGPA